MAPKIDSVKLIDGNLIPLVGFGTWQAAPGEVGKSVDVAIKAGYRHLDFAKIYKNQKEIAPTLKQVPREELFITSKLWNNVHKPELVEKALDDTLKELDLTYLDLYLIHWPVAFLNKTGNYSTEFQNLSEDGKDILLDQSISLADTWKAVVALKKTGKVKSVGVSNATPRVLEELIKATGEVPAVNQVERHPHLLQRDLVEYAAKKNIHLTAYSPLGNNSVGYPLLTEHPVVKKIAEKHNVTTGQVLVSWAIVDKISVIPKSVTPSRIEQNIEPVTLDKEDIAAIDEIGEKDPRRFNASINYKPAWNINVFDTPEEKDAKYQINIDGKN